MTDLSTTLMGLKLKNPLIVGACGLTKSAKGVKECEAAGAGAVVLKSIFEEQILSDINALQHQNHDQLWHPEAAEYINNFVQEEAVSSYLDTIKACKENCNIPIIASIGATSAGSWVDFSKKIEDAGADAIELNIMSMTSDPRIEGEEKENIHFDIVKSVKNATRLPVTVKMGFHFSSLSHFLTKLSYHNLEGLTLFNRSYKPDFDIEKLELTAANFFSSPTEYLRALRWISILHGRVESDLIATSGIHTGETVIKNLLGGAQAVQVVSALYQKGVKHIGTMLKELEEWMERKDFKTIEEFRGKLSQDESSNPAAYERVQFMKGTIGFD